MTDERVTRECSKCGQTDDHPHHVQYVAFTHPATGEGVDLSISKHIDCCAEDGCAICSLDMEYAPKGAHGATMIEFLENRSDEHKQRLFEELGCETVNFQVPLTAEEA
jgi:hypothetical protein